MNAREISEVSIKLKSIINAVDEGGLRRVAAELENAVIRPYGMFDAAVMSRMKDSKQRNGTYIIHVDDIESIKSIKAVINILRSTDAAANTIIKPAIDGVIGYLKTSSKKEAAKGLLSGATGWATEYVAAKWADIWNIGAVEYDGEFNPANAPTSNRVDQALQLTNDISALKFYMGQLGSVMPELSGLSDQSQETIMRLQGALNETDVMKAAASVQEINNNKNAVGGVLDFANTAAEKQGVTSLERTLDSIKEAAGSAISTADREKYYDQKSDRYRFPDATKTGAKQLPASQNLMIAYNVANRAKKTIARVNEFMDTWNKTKSLPVTQLPAMLELLNKLGKMVKDFQQLDNSQLSQMIKNDMNAAMKEIITALAPHLPQLAALAQETELRVGMRDNYLLAQLEGVAQQFESYATTFNIPITSRYPYPEQKNAVIQKMKSEAEQRVQDLQEVQRNLSERKYDVLPSMSDLSIMHAQASRITTPAGSDYQNGIKKLIDQSTGMDKLTIDINNAENKLFQLSQLKATDHTYKHADLVKGELSKLRKLYAIRDQLQEMIDDPGLVASQHYVTGRSGVGILVEGQNEISVPKSFKTAASKAVADIDGLITADKNNIARLDDLAAKNKALIGASTDVKRNRMNALQTMRGSTIAETRGNIAKQRTASNDRAYTNLQKKVNQPDDKAIYQSVINKKKGSVIVQCETARKAMMDNARNYLSESQFLALDPNNKNSGLYELQQGDGLLVANIKQMSNMLTRLERLMAQVNQALKYIESGGLAYANLPGLLPELISEMGNLVQDMTAVNASMLAMRESLGHTAQGEMMEMMSGIMGDINRNIPSKLLEICTDAETEILSSIDPAYASRTHELFAAATQFIKSTDAFVRRGEAVTMPTPASEQKSTQTSLVNLDPGVINAMVSILQKKLEHSPAAKSKSGQLYRLSNFTDGSTDKSIAGIANALVNLNNSLEATVKISNSKGMQGSLDLIKNLYGVYAALNEATPSILAAMAPQIKAFLEHYGPLISQLYASAAVTEKTMGLRDGSMTASLDGVVKLYQDLAVKYGATIKEPAPFYASQIVLAQKEHARLLQEKSKPGGNTDLIKIQIDKTVEVISMLTNKLEAGSRHTVARVGRA